MELKAYRQKMAQAGPHPGLSPWLTDTVLLYRCKDISEEEFRRRVLALSQQFETLLEQALPENLEPETYQLSSGYYDAIASCLESYLDGIDELLYWADTGDGTALESSRRRFTQGDLQWNRALDEALEAEILFQEVDEALMRSMGGDPAGYSAEGF